MTATVIYEGKLRTRAEHQLSGTLIETDAPRDNRGRGERFSPTDLVATALGSCMLTIMGIRAEELGIALEGVKVQVEKIMSAAPRRIAEIKIRIEAPPGRRYSLEERRVLEKAAAECPVALSLHPDVKQSISFRWEQ